MLLRVPSFYTQFRCLADKCTDTCCVGWEIDVDENTLNKYKGIAAQKSDNRRKQFAKKFLENVENGQFKLLPGDRCPFLQQNGLCEVICNMGTNGEEYDEAGENVLCEICREHPRFVEVYGDVMEKGIGLCCEEAARLLLENDDALPSVIAFAQCEIDEKYELLTDTDKDLRDGAFKERDKMNKILADRKKPLDLRLFELLNYAEEVDQQFYPPPEERDYFEDPDELLFYYQKRAIDINWIATLNADSFGPAWDRAYERILLKGKLFSAEEEGTDRPKDCLFSDDDGARIVSYMLFRYYAKYCHDVELLPKVQFAVYFWIMLMNFGNELAAETPADAPLITRKVNAIKLLSKQLEYSEDVMDFLERLFIEHPMFNLEQFRRIVLDNF